MSRSHPYDAAATEARRPPAVGVHDDRDLIRLATLAASSHNTQPWLFTISGDSMAIRPDRSRRCPVVDPDDAHLYKSLGCAAENLVHAASIQGRTARVRYDVDMDAVVVQFTPSPDLRPTRLSVALTTRQCTKGPYDGTPLRREELTELEQAGTGNSVRCVVVTDTARMAAVSDLIERGNLAQLAGDEFRDELVSWIRFNPRVALRTRDGLAGRVSRQPPLPTPLGELIAPFVIKAPAQVKTDRTGLETAAGVALFFTTTDSKQAWVEAGRAYERFSLAADLLDIRSAFINQPIEEPALRPELEALFDTPEHAQLMVRLGHGPRAPYSLRRPVNDVIRPPAATPRKSENRPANESPHVAS